MCFKNFVCLQWKRRRMMNSKNYISEESTPSGALSIRGVSNSAGSVPIVEMCTKCKKNSKYSSSVWCKVCFEEWRATKKEENTAYWKQYAVDNKEKIAKRLKEYREKNKVKVHAQNKEYQNKPGRKDKRNANERERKKRDPMYKIRINLHTRLWFFLRGLKKSIHTMDLVGCDLDFLKEHLQSQFDNKMNWDNYGSYWHCDHIIGCMSGVFDLTKLEDQKKCFHWTNLQPLEGRENEEKGAKIIEKHIKQFIKNQKKHEELKKQNLSS